MGWRLAPAHRSFEPAGKESGSLPSFLTRCSISDIDRAGEVGYSLGTRPLIGQASKQSGFEAVRCHRADRRSLPGLSTGDRFPVASENFLPIGPEAVDPELPDHELNDILEEDVTSRKMEIIQVRFLDRHPRAGSL